MPVGEVSQLGQFIAVQIGDDETLHPAVGLGIDEPIGVWETTAAPRRSQR